MGLMLAAPTMLALAAGPAAAQAPAADRPPLVASRESSVLYRLTKAGTVPSEVRVTARAGGSPLRIDMEDGTYMLVDQAAKTMAIVIPAEQSVLDLPFRPGPQTPFQLNDRMRFTRRNPDTVAGIRCIVWDVSVDKARGTVCVSEDGVVLRSTGSDEAGRRNLIEAVSVSYAPAPAHEFTAPADFDRIAAEPNLPGAPTSR